MQSINVLGICGSPRKNKNSRFLLEFALEAAEITAPEVVKTELYSISGKTFHPCDSCHQCETLGHCRKTDDDFAELRDKWLAADAVIYSVPVYHMGIPSQLKSFIDRVGHSVQESFNDRALKVMGFLHFYWPRLAPSWTTQRCMPPCVYSPRLKTCANSSANEFPQRPRRCWQLPTS